MKQLRRIFGFAAMVVAAASFASVAFTAEPVTTPLTLRPGLRVNFSIYDGYANTGERLGDYDFVNTVKTVSPGGGYSYDWFMTAKYRTAGSQTVSVADRKQGLTVHEYWGDGDQSAKGYVSYLTVSDATFAAVKAGKETAFHLDDAEDPRTIKKIGEEDLATMINEKPAILHTIKVKGAAGGTFWILDNAAFPMIVRGETKWKWMATAISDTGSAGEQVVSQLASSGEASTHAILFAFDSAELDAEAVPVLDSVVQYLKANPKIRLQVQGHTDNIGGAAFNLALSQKRAEAVKAYFTKAGLAADRFAAKGFGLTVPVADNATPEGRARNRRVVFKAL